MSQKLVSLQFLGKLSIHTIFLRFFKTETFIIYISKLFQYFLKTVSEFLRSRKAVSPQFTVSKSCFNVFSSFSVETSCSVKNFIIRYISQYFFSHTFIYDKLISIFREEHRKAVSKVEFRFKILLQYIFSPQAGSLEAVGPRKTYPKPPHVNLTLTTQINIIYNEYEN